MSDTYGAPRSRCGTCSEFQTEGEMHVCPRTGKTAVHTNPHAPQVVKVTKKRKDGSDTALYTIVRETN